MSINKCSTCFHWVPGIPIGTCSHSASVCLSTSDTMVFDNSGVYCPLNIRDYRNEMLLNPTVLISQLKSFCASHDIRRVVVGISGGKDSTIVAKLMVDVLGVDNVLGVLMPNGIQCDISDSHSVVDLLGIKSIIVNIDSSFSSLCSSVDSSLCSLTSSLSSSAKINIAPRIRMSVLYSVAQSLGSGWRVAGTTNKSEAYIGWLTKWGDGGCDFEPIIDFTVRELLILGLSLGLPRSLVYKDPIDGLSSFSDEERFGFSYSCLDSYIESGSSNCISTDSKISEMHLYSEHKRSPIPCFHPSF